MRRPATRTITRYLRSLAPLMGLGVWRFDVDPTPAPSEMWATAAAERGQSSATIAFNDDLWALSAVEQRRIFCHELLHVHLAPLDWSFEDVTAHLSKRAAALARATWEQRSERACDDISLLLAPRLPLPPWTAG